MNIQSQHFRSLNGLDKKMLKYINFERGFFVELGANDGVDQSNTYYYDKAKQWTGLLIEPNEKFLELCKNRQKDGNHLYNEACCSFENKGKSIKFIYSNLMTIAENIKGDVKDINAFIESSRRWNNKIYTFLKEGVPLSELLDKCKAPRDIDFLSLDTEGLEMEVLQGVDFSKYNFKYMLIECRDIDRLSKFLQQFNYKCIDRLSLHDYVFYKGGSN